MIPDRLSGDPRQWFALNRTANGLGTDLALYALAAVFAAVTAVASTLPPHRSWGALASVGYLVAAVAVAGQLLVRQYAANAPRAATTRLTGTTTRLTGTTTRAAVAAVTWATTALLPLIWQCVQRARGHVDRAQEEIIVIEQAGARLLNSGTPYLDREAIAALPAGEQLLGYTPYQPGMALFGLPRAVAGAGWWTDPRIWCALVTAGALIIAVAALRRLPARAPTQAAALLRAVQFATVLPVCTLALATSGDDLPVLTLCLLALALAAVRRPGAAGMAVGLAATLKLFAWPVALVLLLHAALQDWRTLARLAIGALGLPLAALIPAQLVDSAALVENVLRFPLGHGLVSSPAQSPFPGYLIASALPAGRLIAAGLLIVAGLVISIQLVRRPPRTATTAALFCGYGLLVAILLIPATRFGYLLYPAAFLAWVPTLRSVDSPPDPTAQRGAPIPAAAR